jgi:hypothetical protein
MQALRVQFHVYEGEMDWVHGGGEMVEGLFIPESGILLGMNNGKPIVTKCLEAPGQVVGHLDLPNVLLPVIHEYLEAERTIKSTLNAYLST